MPSLRFKHPHATVQEGQNKEVEDVSIKGAKSKEHLDIPSSVDHFCKHMCHAEESKMEQPDSYEDR
jgi:hypothetical protein